MGNRPQYSAYARKNSDFNSDNYAIACLAYLLLKHRYMRGAMAGEEFYHEDSFA